MSAENQIVDKRERPPISAAQRIQRYIAVVLVLVAALLVYVARGTAKKREEAADQQTQHARPSDVLARMTEERQRQEDASSASRGGHSFASRYEQPEPPTAPRPAAAYYAGGAAAGGQGGGYGDQQRNEERARLYRSRFASSIAFTAARPGMRPTAQQGVPGAPPQTDEAQDPSAAARARGGDQRVDDQKPKNLLPARAKGPAYALPQGTILDAVLLTRLDGERPGPVQCMTTDDVYSHDLQHVLIPGGSTLLGTAARVEEQGQARLAVTFDRLIMPDLFSVQLSHEPGLDQVGATAFKDKVDNHYLRVFGGSLAIGLLGGVANIGNNSATAYDGFRAGVGTSMSQSATHVLDKMLNVLPTVTIREGYRVRVYLTEDLLLPDYANHLMPPNL